MTRTWITALLAVALVAPASAQFDINTIMQQQGMGMRMVDDTDPFVENTFTGSFRMEMHLFDSIAEKRESPMNIRYWSSADMTMVQAAMPGMAGREVKMLTDLKGKWQYMLMTDAEGKRMAMKSKKKKMVITDTLQQKENAKSDMAFTVTKEKKTIDGHVCTKVIGKGTDGSWTGWVAMDLKGPYADMAKHVRSADPTLNKQMSAVPGFALEFEWVPTGGKDRIVCYIRDLLPGGVDADVFSLDGYELIAIPGM
jgi:hypothetical protein